LLEVWAPVAVHLWREGVVTVERLIDGFVALLLAGSIAGVIGGASYVLPLLTLLVILAGYGVRSIALTYLIGQQTRREQRGLRFT
jgi:hypothetical protein